MHHWRRTSSGSPRATTRWHRRNWSRSDAPTERTRHRPSSRMERRDFLLYLSRYAALCAVVPNVWRVTARPRLADDPFTLGVASGDPTPSSGILWTRLAPRPLEPDG